MTKRVRSRRNGRTIPASLYWALFRFSPLVMLVGMAAGGLLIVRSVLVWGVGGDEYRFGADIPVAAVCLIVWAGAVTLLLMPPDSVLAKRDGGNSSSVLVWPLGRRFRFWTVVAAPICGLLGALVVPLAIQVASLDLTDAVTLWLGLPLYIGMIAMSLGLCWIVLRGAMHGVELTSTHLLARGYFTTRRISRSRIVSINAVELTWWPSLLLSTMMNRSVEHTIRLSLDDGPEPLLLASNSHQQDVENGAEIVRAWRVAFDESSRTPPTAP